jgi:hypothetical protein
MSRNRKLNSDSRLSRRSLLQITTAGVLASTLGTAAVSGLSPVEITIPETDVDARIWGNSFRTPTDLIVTAENPRLTDSYTYESFDGQTTEEAPTGQQFAFIDLTVENDAGESRTIPSSLAFELAAKGEQVEPLNIEYERDNDYTGGNDVLDGVNTSGVLPYQIPAEATIDDLRLFYDDSIILGADVAEWQVTWQSGSIGDRSTFSVTETSVPSQIPQSGTYQVSVTVENVGSVTATETVKYCLLPIIQREREKLTQAGDERKELVRNQSLPRAHS